MRLQPSLSVESNHPRAPYSKEDLETVLDYLQPRNFFSPKDKYNLTHKQERLLVKITIELRQSTKLSCDREFSCETCREELLERLNNV